MSRPAKQVRLFVIWLSLLVFLFALSAKLSVYQNTHPLTANNTSKLWVAHQKMEADTSIHSSQSVLPGIFVTLLFFALLLVQSSRPADLPLIPAPSADEHFAVYRFLRPPPIS